MGYIYIHNGKHDHYTVYVESQCHKPAKLGDGFFYHPSEKHMKCPVTYVLHGGHLCLLNIQETIIVLRVGVYKYNSIYIPSGYLT